MAGRLLPVLLVGFGEPLYSLGFFFLFVNVLSMGINQSLN